MNSFALVYQIIQQVQEGLLPTDALPLAQLSSFPGSVKCQDDCSSGHGSSEKVGRWMRTEGRGLGTGLVMVVWV